MPGTRVAIQLALTAMLLAVGCSTSPGRSRAPLAEPETRDYRSCEADSDCVVARNGCCDCANGGHDIAVHRDHQTAFAARFDCAGAVCTARGREPACGTGSATCVSGLCTYQEPATH